MDRGYYHTRKRELRSQSRVAIIGQVVGFLTCWTGIGLIVLWKCIKWSERVRDEREQLEREFEQYERDAPRDRS